MRKSELAEFYKDNARQFAFLFNLFFVKSFCFLYFSSRQDENSIENEENLLSSKEMMLKVNQVVTNFEHAEL